MPHYALLDESNIVTGVVSGVTDDEETRLAEIFDCTVKRTSYNTQYGIHLLEGTPFRFTFAGKGMTYDETNDVFIPENFTWNSDEGMPMKAKPLDKDGESCVSWVRDTSNNMWKAPLDVPTDYKTTHYEWDESAYQADNTTGWVITEPE